MAGIKKRKTFIFDFDDTLLSVEHDYGAQLLKFGKLMIKELSYKCPYIPDLLNLCKEVDIKNVESQGYNKIRFPNSLQDVYRELCRRSDIPVIKRVEQKCYDLGLGAFEFKNSKVIDGAKECLEFLAHKKDELILLTKGDEEIQRRKIIKFWFDDYFSEIFISYDKNKQIFNEVIGSRDKSLVYSVGNTFKADIYSALKAGIKAIYIPFGSWERHNGKIHSNFRLKQFKNIKEIIENYRSL
jgi:FMN phosphatase YigB (HAD superfamily)